jgi:molybdopterin-guanine dinucleotide biosynthesis protein A
MADACDEALSRGDSKIIDPLVELDFVAVGAEDLADFDSESFESVDTPEEFAAAEKRLKG